MYGRTDGAPSCASKYWDFVRSNAISSNAVTSLYAACYYAYRNQDAGAVYQQLKGVQSVESGYTGGHIKNPTYEQVCNGDTGHAEVVKLTFDPQEI
eukprot:gene19737-20208_t